MLGWENLDTDFALSLHKCICKPDRFTVFDIKKKTTLETNVEQTLWQVFFKATISMAGN